MTTEDHHLKGKQVILDYFHKELERLLGPLRYMEALPIFNTRGLTFRQQWVKMGKKVNFLCLSSSCTEAVWMSSDGTNQCIANIPGSVVDT